MIQRSQSGKRAKDEVHDQNAVSGDSSGSAHRTHTEAPIRFGSPQVVQRMISTVG
jgi:hypothetical protein